MLSSLAIALALSMDAFSVALSSGLNLVNPGWRKPLLVAAYFGAFQSAMAFIGWAGGEQAARYFGGIDHWIAAFILMFLGAKMLAPARCGTEKKNFSFSHTNLALMGLATSLDAMGAGASLAFSDADIAIAISLIGLVAFGLSFAGVRAGRLFGSCVGKRAEYFGGIMLLVIALAILSEHGAFSTLSL